MILLLVEVDNLIVPLVIYFKGDRGAITRREVRYHTEIVRREMEGE